MRFLIVCVLFLVAMASSASQKQYYDVNEAPALFEKFMREHDRTYKDEEDKKVHFEAFKESLKKINDLNAKSPHTTFGINKFADYTEDERKTMFGLRLPSN